MIDRIIIKIIETIKLLHKKAVINIAIKRGLKLGKNVYIEGVPKFGSEPFLIEIGDNSIIAENVSFICHAEIAMSQKELKNIKMVGYLEE